MGVRADLKNQVNVLYPDNNNGEITPERLRSQQNAILDDVRLSLENGVYRYVDLDFNSGQKLAGQEFDYENDSSELDQEFEEEGGTGKWNNSTKRIGVSSAFNGVIQVKISYQSITPTNNFGRVQFVARSVADGSILDRDDLALSQGAAIPAPGSITLILFVVQDDNDFSQGISLKLTPEQSNVTLVETQMIVLAEGYPPPS